MWFRFFAVDAINTLPGGNTIILYFHLFKHTLTINYIKSI